MKNKFVENIWVKRTLSTALALSLGIGLVGCGNDTDDTDDVDTGDEDATEAESSDELSGELTMWTASLSGEPFDSYFDDLKKDFEELHPDIELTIEDIPQDEMQQKVLTSLTGDGDDVPDVVNLAPRYTDAIASQGGLLNLSDEISEEVQETYIEGPFNAGYYEDDLYALPWYITGTVGWYNEEHFEEADITEMPENYSEIYETGKKITEATGSPSFYVIIGEGEGLLDDVFSLANGKPIVEDGKTVIEDHDDILEFFDLSQKMYEEGIIPEENIEGSYPTSQEAFMAENISFTMTGAQFLGPIKDGAPEVYEAARATAPFDNGELPKNISVMQFSIPEKTNNPDAAVELAKFVTNAENQLNFSKTAGTVLPATKVSLEDEYFTDSGDSREDEARVESVKTLDRSEVMDVKGESQPELREIIKTNYIKNLQGDLTPEEALNTIAEQWDAIFEKNDEQPTF